MILEIHGAGFKNKGAQLMLQTAVAELQARIRNFIPAVDPMYGSYDQRCQLGLYQILPPRSHVGTRGFAWRLKKQRCAELLKWSKAFQLLSGARPATYGCVGLSEIGGLIDISGFAYTEQWGTQPTKDFALLTSYYRSRGKPVLLLPQAFGPFRSPEIRLAFRQAMDNATLVFARDRKSYDHVSELCSEPGKISRSPDITMFYKGTCSGNVADQLGDYACVVPNARLLDQGRIAWADKYLNYTREIIRKLVQMDLKVLLIVHDASGEDLKLAREMLAHHGASHLRLVEQEDPVILKTAIGGARVLVGSRYHSLVSAFSMGVPALALGWSHKYEGLFEDFEFERFMIPSDAPLDVAIARVEELTDPDRYPRYRQRIDDALQKLRSLNERMWTKVTKALQTPGE